MLEFFFYLSHSLSMVELWPFSSPSTDCVVSLRGDWAIWLAQDGLAECQGKLPKNTSPRLAEPGPQGGSTDSEIHSVSRWAITTRATERTDSEIHSFSHWATKTRATERADGEIHLFSHWAIMTDPLKCRSVYKSHWLSFCWSQWYYFKSRISRNWRFGIRGKGDKRKKSSDS